MKTCKSAWVLIIFALIILGGAQPSSAWFSVLTVKWDIAGDDPAAGYWLYMDVYKDGVFDYNYKVDAGDDGEQTIDVEDDKQHHIRIVPYSSSGIESDPIMELNFTPHGITKKNTITF